MTTMETVLVRPVDEQRIASTLSPEARPNPPGALSASLTLGWRSMLKLKHVPSQLVDAILFPILITLMFAFVFGGALGGSVEEYIHMLIPGVLVLTVAMTTQHTALGLNTDIHKGIFDRFRALSFWRPAVLVGALMGDMVRYTLAGVVVVALGYALGFRPAAGLGGLAAAFGLALLFAFSLSWIWTSLGLLIDDPGTVGMIASLVSFPLLFVSNVFADPATMPAFLQPLVRYSPISLTATAVRGAAHGTATSGDIGLMLLGCAVLVGVFAPLTMRLYNRKDAE